MRSGERPFELLNSKERETFQLCREVIVWTSDENVYFKPGIQELRQEATALFEQAQSMDMAHNDRYYYVLAGASQLKKHYQEIRTRMENNLLGEKTVKVIFDFAQGTVEELILLVRGLLKEKRRYAQIEIENFVSNLGRRDGVQLTIYDWQRINECLLSPLEEKGYRVDCVELFNDEVYTSFGVSWHIDQMQSRFKDLFGESPVITKGRHENGQLQGQIHIPDTDEPQKIEEILKLILSSIQSTPRVKNGMYPIL